MAHGTIETYGVMNRSGVIKPDDGSKPLSFRGVVNQRGDAAIWRAGQRVCYELGVGLFGNAYAKNVSPENEDL